MPSICRSFQDLLVVQISHKLTKYCAHYCVLCHMALLGERGLKKKIVPPGIYDVVYHFYNFSNVSI